MENPGLLPLQSDIRQIRAGSGTGRNWDHDTGTRGTYMARGYAERSFIIFNILRSLQTVR